MSRKPKSGDRVILETNSCEIYDGYVESISNQAIELYNVYSQTNDVQFDGALTFFRNEVKSISIITQNSIEEDPFSEESDSSFQERKKIKLHPDEYERLKEMYFNFKFIDIYNASFKEAVNILKNRESVAVVGLGNNFKRGKPLSLLLVSDFEQVFIFDMLCLTDLRELTDILESDYIVKVVHDGTALFDCLYHKYKVEMKNIFDTQVVDTMLEKEAKNIDVKRNISECLAYHFNFPLALLSAAMEDMNTKVWTERPVTKSNKRKAAQLVTFLLTLRDHLLKQILKKYTVKTEQIYNEFKHLSDGDLLSKSMNLNISS